MKSSLRDLLDWLWKFFAKLLIVVVTGKNSPKCTDKIVRKDIDTNDPEMAVGHETQMTETPVKDAETLLKNDQSASTLSLNDEDVYPDADGEITEKRTGFETESANVDVDALNNESSADVNLEVTEVNRQESNGYMNEVNANVDSVNGENVQSNGAEAENRNNEVGYENVRDRERTVTFSLPEGNDGVVGAQQMEDASNAETFFSDNSNVEAVFSDSSNVETVFSDSSNVETVFSDNSNVETVFSEANNVENASSATNNVETVPPDEKDRTNYINEDDACGYFENYDSSPTDELKVCWLLKLSPKAAYHEVLAPQYYSLNIKTAAELPMENVQTALKQLRRLIPWLGLGLRRRKKDMWICLYPEDHVDYPVVEEDQLWNVVSSAREQFNYMENGCICTFRIQKSHPCTQCQTPVVGTETSPDLKVSSETISSCSEEPDAATSGQAASADRISTPTSARTVNMDVDETGIERIPNVCDSNANFTTTLTSSSLPKDDSEQIDSTLVPYLIPPSGNSTDACLNLCRSENEISADSIANNSPASSSSLAKDSKETKSMSYYYRLIFGIPHPLADETLAKHICDNFIKELNQVISENCVDTVSSSGTDSPDEINDNQTGLQNNCDTVVPNSDCNNGATTENGCEQGQSKNSEQSNTVSNNDSVNEIDSDVIKAGIQQQITAIESAFTSHEKSLDEKEKMDSQPNMPEAVDRNSPYIERRLEMSHTKNFLNKCKTLRVNFVSGFATCLNVAVANFLVKYGCNEEDQNVKIGHGISVYYSFEDLSEYEWQDNDNSNESNEEEVTRIDCCISATATLNIKPCNWHSGFWERVQLVHKKRLTMVGASPSTFHQKIPLGMDSEVKEEDFAPVYHPSANLSIASIQSQAKEFPRQMDHIESTSYEELSPVIIFLRTNTITLNLSENCLRFTYYNQGHFIPHQSAHDFADDILSVLEKSISS